MTTRRMWSVGVLMLVPAVSPLSVFAQGDGPRVHWKEMLTDTNLFSLTYINASGNANPVDPAHTIVPGADFDAACPAGSSRSIDSFTGDLRRFWA